MGRNEKNQTQMEEKKMSDLKPCPFCGSENVIPVEADYLNEGGKVTILWDVECQDCQSLVRKSMWNRRPAEDAKTREIDNLKRALQQIVEIANRRGHLTVATLQKDAWYGLAKIANEALTNAPDMNDGKMEGNK